MSQNIDQLIHQADLAIEKNIPMMADDKRVSELVALLTLLRGEVVRLNGAVDERGEA